jgi:hypothetical protein
MKTYLAEAGYDQGGRVMVDDGVKRRPLTHHVYHSPTGYAWGYNGSGPAELAKDILWNLLGEKPISPLYQDFKAQFIASFAGNAGWSLSETEIRAWLAARDASTG